METTTNLNFSPSTLSFQHDLTEDIAAAIGYDGDANPFVTCSVQAQYAGGCSDWGSADLQSLPAPAVSLVIGWQGRLYCIFQNLPADLSNVRIYRQASLAFGLDGNAMSSDYTSDYSFYENTPSPVNDDYFEIPASSITNGICVLPDSQLPPYFAYNLCIQTVRSNGVASGWAQPSVPGDWFFTAASTPFVDARSQLKDNLRFLLRSATSYSPFAFQVYIDGYSSFFTWPNNYVFADCYYSGIANYYDEFDEFPIWQFNDFRPINDNCFYRNFLFDQTQLAANGFLDTGCYQATSYYVQSNGYNHSEFSISITNLPSYYFDLAGYFSMTNPSVPTSQLTTTPSQWILPSYSHVGGLAGGTFATGQHNGYGLPYVSEKLAYVTNGQSLLATFYPGNTLPSGVSGVSYLEMAQPDFQSAGYYFARPGIDLMPEQAGFATTNATPFMVQSIGSSQQIAGYAKLGIQNGYSGVYGYLGQYFDQAYKVNTNGTATANTTGILSPQGNFFATDPGQVALVTMPDVDTGARGTCTVYCVSLQLDANHDGNMDLSFNGADATSAANPAQIWVNNNYDRGHTVDGNDFEQDDLSPAQVANLNVPAEQKVPDCRFVNNGLPAIPCTRDLEDYFRLWLPGIASAMKAMPANYTVQLTLTGDGQIRIFHAVEPDGGTNYLFDAATASNQVAQSASLYVGLLTSSSPIVFNRSTNFNEHFIVCGAQTGSAQVDLQILDGNGNVVADSPTYIQINDIKLMYERWTVGDTPSIAPKTMPLLDSSDLTNPPTSAFQYTPPQDTTTPYILLVHGWNMERWEKDRYAEAAYKRLYWQGYKGRFGIFRWPTGNGISDTLSAVLHARNYDNSEFTAWQSAVGLTNLLTQLNAEYPGHVYLMAHSMGNVVAGEALRLASSQLVNAYVAMQGAVPAHCYDNSTVNRTTSSVPDRHGHYWTDSSPSYFNASAGAGKYVNFQNTNDYALSKWTLDQNLKPDNGIWGIGINYPGYFYSSSSGFYKIVGSTTNGTIYLNFPANTYEIFAYDVPAWSYALGAQPGVGGVFKVGQTYRQIDLNAAPYGFGAAHKGHSAQFRSDNMSRAVFWNTLIDQMGLTP